jgi:hypothetical protein
MAKVWQIIVGHKPLLQRKEKGQPGAAINREMREVHMGWWLRGIGS